MQTFDFDLFVIGGGSGGVRAARMSAQRGARVGLAEVRGHGRHLRQRGLHPEKLYSYAAHYGDSFEESHGFGWDGEKPVFDWDILKANRAREIARLNGIYVQLLESAGVKIIKGWAPAARRTHRRGRRPEIHGQTHPDLHGRHTPPCPRCRAASMC